VLNDFGAWLGRAWRETDEDAPRDSDRLLLAGEYSNPIRIVAFNIAEGWRRDVTMDIADEVRRRVVEYDQCGRRSSTFCRPTGAEWLDQGTFTGGIDPVGCGTKRCSCDRAIAEKVIRTAIKITSWRAFNLT
jgi:hypothetical protein